MQLKVIQFLHGYLVRVSHYIVCLSILPFWAEMAKMMILSDCYQVNLMIDHKPARLKIGFINFTAISEYYLLWLGLFFLPAGRELGIIVDITNSACLSWNEVVLSLQPHPLNHITWRHRYICIQCELHISQTNIFISRCKIFMFGMLQIWHGVSSLSNIIIAVQSSAKLCLAINFLEDELQKSCELNLAQHSRVGGGTQNGTCCVKGRKFGSISLKPKPC